MAPSVAQEEWAAAAAEGWAHDVELAQSATCSLIPFAVITPNALPTINNPTPAPPTMRGTQRDLVAPC